MTPLLMACKHKHYHIVELLLSDPRVDVNMSDALHNTTPLFAACTLRASSTVQHLVDCKADPNIRSTNGATPAIVAARYGDLEMLQILSQHPDLDICICDNKGQTPMSIAKHKHKHNPSIAAWVSRLVRQRLACSS